jgi:hypothetical protein
VNEAARDFVTFIEYRSRSATEAAGYAGTGPYGPLCVSHYQHGEQKRHKHREAVNGAKIGKAKKSRRPHACELIRPSPGRE